MYSDYHIHSNFSFDSDENMENIVKQAVKLNMPQICITNAQRFQLACCGRSSPY